MVPKWILKAVVQKTISYLPFRHRINFFFQKYVTKGVFLTDEYFTDRLQHARNHLRYYRRFSSNAHLETTLELGTGWYPVVPICMFLSGASTIYTVDISSLSSKEHVITTIEKFVNYYRQGKLAEYMEVKAGRIAVLEDLLENQHLLNLEDLTRRLHLQYLIQDARHLSIDSSVIDLVHSNNTFEHVFPEILEALLVEFNRIARPGGILSHFVDMSDHFAHFDRSINIYHYLRFSDQQWAWIDNDIQPQNRWRINDYKALYHKLGLEIAYLDVRKGNLNLLKQIEVNKKYQNYPMSDLAISHCHIVSTVEEQNA